MVRALHPSCVDTRAPNLEDLPDIVLDRIFDYITVTESVSGKLCQAGLRLAAVSLRLNVFYRESYVKTIRLHGGVWRNSDHAPALFARALRRLPSARRVDLAYSVGVVWDMRTAFNNRVRCASLREVICAQTPLVDDDLLHIIRTCPRLEVLNVIGCLVRDNSICALIENQHPTLRHLYLGNTFITDESGERLGALQRLTALGLSATRNTPGNAGGFGARPQLTCRTFSKLQRLPGLQELSLRGTSISSEELSRVLQCLTRLEMLNVSFCENLLCDVLFALPPSMRKLDVSETSALQDISMESGVPRRAFLHARSIEVLTARYAECFVDLAVLQPVAESMRVLDVSGTDISDGTTVVLQQMRRLETLRMSDCEGVGDVTVRRMADLGRLASVDLSNTGITGDGVRVLTKCVEEKALRDVDVLYCEAIDYSPENGAVQELRRALEMRTNQSGR